MHTGTKDGCCARLLTGQQIRGCTGGCPCAQGGQVRAIHHSDRFARRRIHHGDQRVDERQSLGRIVVEDGDNFDRHLVAGRQIGWHKKSDAIVAGDLDCHPEWHVSATGAKLRKGGFHGLNGFSHRQRLAHIFARKDTDHIHLPWIRLL